MTDLLKYVLHARNADEHGLAPVTTNKEGSIGLRPKKGIAWKLIICRSAAVGS